ncbi:uncharacterized protein J3D65DRAFT_663415 [Phyllosticta citribraziliensis]|uniref:Small secreted protein n=1 Tax=Phyllosticta citribraziliensis TaxID=989973 RepID=A0ABR1MA32_9PEZI
MVSFKILSALALAGLAAATLEPCTSNTKGKKPSVDLSSADKSSDDIQAAECSHNTRVSGDQTFAVFITDHSKDENHGAPYGAAGGNGSMVTDADAWTFFWSNLGSSSGVGTGCIKDPEDGTCGCENSDGSWAELTALKRRIMST